MPKRTAEHHPKLIDRQRRIVLPPEVLEALGADAGDYVSFEVDGAKVAIYKVRWVPDEKKR